MAVEQNYPDTYEQQEDFIPVNKKGLGFAIAAFLYEIIVCLVYGLLFGYNQTADVTQQSSLFIAILIILAIAGFGLINAYITNASFSGMALSLLVFALTIQHYFMMRAFWDKAGANDPTHAKSYSQKRYDKLSFTNIEQDRGETFQLSHASVADAIACAISLLVAFASLVGRIQILEVFFLTLLGAFFYEVNNQLFWNIFITDIGFGMRIFIFGSCLGIIASCIMGRFDTTLSHYYYKSIYATRGMGLVGLVIIFSTFPMLVVAGVYNVSTNYSYITESSVLNMYLALGAGVLGAFAMSGIIHGKIFLHDLVYSGLSGGIVYSSSCNLHRNPAVPLTVGFLMGLVMSAYNSQALRTLNKNGVKSSLNIINMYLIPGLFSGFLSAILHGVNQGSFGNYVMRADPTRTFIQQGGYQIIGVLLSAGIGIFAGVIIGVIFKIMNKHNQLQQFNDNEIFALDRKHHYVQEKIVSVESRE